jgi:hypothetical protein
LKCHKTDVGGGGGTCVLDNLKLLDKKSYRHLCYKMAGAEKCKLPSYPAVEKYVSNRIILR